MASCNNTEIKPLSVLLHINEIQQRRHHYTHILVTNGIPGSISKINRIYMERKAFFTLLSLQKRSLLLPSPSYTLESS